MFVLRSYSWEDSVIICCSRDKSKLEQEATKLEQKIEKFKDLRADYNKMLDDLCTDDCDDAAVEKIEKEFCDQHGFDFLEIKDLYCYSFDNGLDILEIKEI